MGVPTQDSSEAMQKSLGVPTQDPRERESPPCVDIRAERCRNHWEFLHERSAKFLFVSNRPERKRCGNRLEFLRVKFIFVSTFEPSDAETRCGNRLTQQIHLCVDLRAERCRNNRLEFLVSNRPERQRCGNRFDSNVSTFEPSDAEITGSS